MPVNKKPLSIFLLVATLLLQSFTALVCGVAMMWDPTGASMQLPKVVLETAPFKNFFIPGFFLFACLGVLPLKAVYALVVKKDPRVMQPFNIYSSFRIGWMLSLFCGFGTLIWITAQLYFTETYFFLQTVYACVGILILVLTLLPSTMRYCRTDASPIS